MYDRKQEANEFVGESVDDATSSAARFYGVDAGELKVVVAEEGSVSGAAGRAIVVAYPKDMKPPTGGGGGGDRDRGGRDRDDSRGRDRDGGRGRGRGRERGGRREREGRGERSEKREAAGSLDTDEPIDSKGTASGDLGPVGEFVLGVVERMSLGNFEISEAAEDDFLVYQLKGDVTSRLGSGDGRAIDALQLLANQASKQLTDEAPRIVIDVEGETADRESSLSRLAGRAAARASETGRAIALDPMNSRDRRIIHVALRDEDKIATMSIGSGRYRQVVVVPEGAPEYDEAVSSSQG